MKYYLKQKIVVTVILITILAMTGLAMAGEPVGSKKYDLTQVNNVLKNAVGEKILSGCSFLLIKDGQVLYKKAFGKGWTTDKVSAIASGTKWLSAGVIMAVVDEGKISLDDPVSKYLPEFTGDKGKMTLAQMFSHTAGMPIMHASIDRTDITLKENVDIISKVDLESAPGTAFAYGALSMQVAARVTEVATGKTWNELFQVKIAEPLGMSHTNYHGLANEISKNPRVSAGSRTTLDDLSKYLTMILNNGKYNGKQVLSKEAVEAMETDRVKGLNRTYDPLGAEYAPHAKLGYGMGNWLNIDESTGKVLEAYSPGALGAWPWIDFENKIIGIFITETNGPVARPICIELMQQVKHALVGTPIPEKNYSYRVSYNGKAIKFLDQRPYINRKNGIGYVPAEIFAEAIGAQVSKNAKAKSLTISLKGKKVRLSKGSNAIIVNGKKQRMPAATVIMGNQMLVPLVPVSKALGLNHEWDKIYKVADVYPVSRGEASSPAFEEYLNSCRVTPAAKGVNAVVQCIVSDAGNAKYVMTIKDGVYSWKKGTVENPNVTLTTLETDGWPQVQAGKLGATEAYFARKITFNGDRFVLMGLLKYLTCKE